jgi:hypothetical protein
MHGINPKKYLFTGSLWQAIVAGKNLGHKTDVQGLLGFLENLERFYATMASKQ